jgi:hypothetical protein
MRIPLRPVIAAAVVLAVVRRIAMAAAMVVAAASVIIVATVAAMAAATARRIAADAVVGSIIAIVVAVAILAAARLLLRAVAAVAPPRRPPKPLPRPRRLLRRLRLRRTNPPNQSRPGHDLSGPCLEKASKWGRGGSHLMCDLAPIGLWLLKPDLELEARLFLLHLDGPHSRGRRALRAFSSLAARDDEGLIRNSRFISPACRLPAPL